MRLPKGVDPKSVGVDDFAVGGMALPKDPSKILKNGGSKVPQAPETAKNVQAAFEAYLQKLADLLLKGKGPRVNANDPTSGTDLLTRAIFGPFGRDEARNYLTGQDPLMREGRLTDIELPGGR